MPISSNKKSVASHKSTPILFALTSVLCASVLSLFTITAHSQTFETPKILSDKALQKTTYLPDYSYAGYHHGEKQPSSLGHKLIDVSKHGIIANDGLDDSKAFIKLLDKLRDDPTPTVLQFNEGRYIISSIIYFDRSNLIIRGAGSGKTGTEFYFPRPLLYEKAPELNELNEYLVELNKIQKEKKE